MTEKTLVSVLCITYNHERYIRQCLDGMLMQRTLFPFEILIHDDASTDRTPDIIRDYEDKYPDIIKPIYQIENQYSKGVNITLEIQFPHAKGKYIALCEGDDYWIDPLKLQKQVDFLENNPDYSMFFHNAIEHFEHKNIKDRLFSNVKNADYSGVEIYKRWIIPTASVVLHRSVIEADLYQAAIKNKKFMFGDILIFLTAANLGRVRGSSDVMSVYRKHEGGVAYNPLNISRLSFFLEHHQEIGNHFGEEYKKCLNYMTSKIYLRFFFLYMKGMSLKCFKYLFLSFFLSPLHFPSIFIEKIHKRIRNNIFYH